jgi:hypothetical protein
MFAESADSMSTATGTSWEAKRTDDSRQVESVLRMAGFKQVDAYRYNSASIRLRVIDPRFEGLPVEQRDAMIEPHLELLPEHIQADIVTLFAFAPSDLTPSSKSLRELLKNTEFEDPSPSML